jgi:rhomboid protease GluP
MNQTPLSVSPGNTSPNQKVISRILSEIYKRYGLDLGQDPVALGRIEGAVERARQELELKPEFEINLPFISANAAGPIHLVRLVTREDYGSIPPAGSLPDGPPDREHVGDTAVRQRIRIDLPDRKPVVTFLLLVITILIYGAQIMTDINLGYDLPAAIGMKSNQLIMDGQYWRLITPMFLHGSILHLGFNMYALYILGRRIERFYGSMRFLALYIIAGITGNMFSFFFTSAPSLGSSTAIFGLLGAEGIFIYQHRKLFGDQSRTALRQIIQVAAVNLLIGLSPGIDNWGHVGGLIGGVIFAGVGGPRFQIGGSSPALRLENIKSGWAAGIGFVLQLFMTAGLVYLILMIRR